MKRFFSVATVVLAALGGLNHATFEASTSSPGDPLGKLRGFANDVIESMNLLPEYTGYLLGAAVVAAVLRWLQK